MMSHTHQPEVRSKTLDHKNHRQQSLNAPFRMKSAAISLVVILIIAH